MLGDPIDVGHIELSSHASARPNITSYRDAKTLFEEEYFERLMRVTAGNVTMASKLSKKTRKEIYDALKRLGLDAAAYRAAGAPPEGDEND